MTIIVADTTSGLPLDLAASRGIPVVPQLVIFGEKTYRDDTELTTMEFLAKLKTSKSLPKTAAPLHTLYTPIFQEAANKGETVLVIAPSAKISGTVRSVETARLDFPQADIRIIDSDTVAGCLGTLVLMASDLLEKGKSADEIEKTIRSYIPRSRTYFIVDTLEYLRRGGRIGAAKALLGEILKVKPILQIKDGQAAPFDQERTKSRAITRLVEFSIEQMSNAPDPRPSVMHIDAFDEAKNIATGLETKLNIPSIPIYLLPPAIIVHAGPKALAVGFFA